MFAMKFNICFSCRVVVIEEIESLEDFHEYKAYNECIITATSQNNNTINIFQ